MFRNNEVFTTFSVGNLKAAKFFYQELLGLEVRELPSGFLELYTNGNRPIILYSKMDHSPASYTILNIVVSNIFEAVQELRRKGIQFEQYQETFPTDPNGIYWGDENDRSAAWFKDPSGNLLCLIEE